MSPEAQNKLGNGDDGQVKFKTLVYEKNHNEKNYWGCYGQNKIDGRRRWRFANLQK
jgi:hypothetical protein